LYTHIYTYNLGPHSLRSTYIYTYNLGPHSLRSTPKFAFGIMFSRCCVPQKGHHGGIANRHPRISAHKMTPTGIEPARETQLARRWVARDRHTRATVRIVCSWSAPLQRWLAPTHTRHCVVVYSRSVAHRCSGLVYGPARTLHAGRRVGCELMRERKSGRSIASLGCVSWQAKSWGRDLKDGVRMSICQAARAVGKHNTCRLTLPN
jgi:hypothetical protein